LKNYLKPWYGNGAELINRSTVAGNQDMQEMDHCGMDITINYLKYCVTALAIGKNTAFSKPVLDPMKKMLCRVIRCTTLKVLFINPADRRCCSGYRLGYETGGTTGNACVVQ
jgi:hypothetical protein